MLFLLSQKTKLKVTILDNIEEFTKSRIHIYVVVWTFDETQRGRKKLKLSLIWKNVLGVHDFSGSIMIGNYLQ